MADWEAERQCQSDSQSMDDWEPNTALQSLLNGGLDPLLEEARMRVSAEMIQQLFQDARAMYLSMLGI